MKEFIEIMRSGKPHLPKSDKITIKKSKKSNITKFKLRTGKYLLTLKVEDRSKAQRIMDSIPPSKWLNIFTAQSYSYFRYRPQEGEQRVSDLLKAQLKGVSLIFALIMSTIGCVKVKRIKKEQQYANWKPRQLEDCNESVYFHLEHGIMVETSTCQRVHPDALLLARIPSIAPSAGMRVKIVSSSNFKSIIFL